MNNDSTPTGVAPTQTEVPLDNGNTPTPTDDGEPTGDEMIEFFEESFGEKPSFINE